MGDGGGGRGGLGWGPGASASPLHLMSMLRSGMSLELKERQLIDAQQPEEQGRLEDSREEGSRWGLGLFPPVFSFTASYASGFDKEGQKGLPEAGRRFSQYSRLARRGILGDPQTPPCHSLVCGNPSTGP